MYAIVLQYLVKTFIGPIVYRLGHILLKDGSGVRLPVGSQIKNLPSIAWEDSKLYVFNKM